MAKKWYAYLFKENIWGLGIQAVTFIAGVLFTLVFPNLLGKEGFGYFSVVIGIASMAVVFADFGIQGAALRFIPEGAKRGVAWKYFRTLLEWKFLLSLAASVLLFLGAGFIAAAYRNPGLADGIRTGAVFLFGYSLFLYLDYAFSAARKAWNSLLLNLAFHFLRFALPLATFFLYRSDYAGVLAGTALAALVPVAIAVFFAAREPLFRGGKEGALDFPALKWYMLFGFVAYLAYSFVQWSDMLIIGLFRPISEVSLYRVAWLWATAAGALLPFSSRILTSAHAYEDEQRSRKMFDLTLRYSFIFSFMMIAGIMLVAEQFLQVVYGGSFAGAYPAMVALSLLTLEISLNSLSGALLGGKGDAKTPMVTSVFAATCQIAALFAFAPQYGIMGAAVGVVVVRIVFALAQASRAVRFISHGIPAGYVWRPALCALIALAVLMPLKPYTYSLPGAFACGVGLVALYGLLAVALKAVSPREIMRLLSGAIFQEA